LVIDRRLQRFEVHEKRVLTAAAVIGRTFSFRLLTEASHIDVDELFTVIEKAQQMGLIIPSAEGPDNPYAFTHELVRQTLLAGISAPRRQQMHATVAATIESLYPRLVEDRAGEIGDHLLKAGSFADGGKLFHYLVVAGKSALKAAAFEEARRYFRSALSHHGTVEARERADLFSNLAIAERGLERTDEVLVNLGQALETHIELSDRAMIGNTAIDLVDALRHAGRFDEAAEAARHALAYLKADISSERARLLAALGQTHAIAANYERAHEALQEALNIASRLSDPMLMAGLLGARALVNFHFCRLNEAAADCLLSEQTGGSEAPPWEHASQLRTLHLVLLHLGRAEEALRIADDLEPLARKIGQTYSIARCIIARAWVGFAHAPDLTKLAMSIQQVSTSEQTPGFAFWGPFFEEQLSSVDFLRGNWTTALVHAQASSQLEVDSATRGLGVGTQFRQMAYAGDRAGALGILDGNRAMLPVLGLKNTRGSWWMLALVIEGLVMLGELSKAAELYPHAREFIGTGAVVLWPVFRFTQTTAGIAASAAHQWEAAEEHFQIAMHQAEALPDRLEQAEIRRFHVMMLLDRAAPGDRDKAQMLLREALVTYTQIGMPRHIEMVQSLLK